MIGDDFSSWLQMLLGGQIWMQFDQYTLYVVFYPSVKFHDDTSVVRKLIMIFVSGFWRCMGVHAALDFDKFWPVGSSYGDLPS